MNEPSEIQAQIEVAVAVEHACMTCQQPTTYVYICEHCSELFLIELWEGGRARGLKT